MLPDQSRIQRAVGLAVAAMWLVAAVYFAAAVSDTVQMRRIDRQADELVRPTPSKRALGVPLCAKCVDITKAIK